MADKLKVWRQLVKITKVLVCDRCNKFKAKSVESLKYHYERCGQSVSCATHHHHYYYFCCSQHYSFHVIYVVKYTPASQVLITISKFIACLLWL